MSTDSESALALAGTTVSSTISFNDVRSTLEQSVSATFTYFNACQESEVETDITVFDTNQDSTMNGHAYSKRSKIDFSNGSYHSIPFTIIGAPTCAGYQTALTYEREDDSFNVESINS